MKKQIFLIVFFASIFVLLTNVNDSSASDNESKDLPVEYQSLPRRLPSLQNIPVYIKPGFNHAENDAILYALGDWQYALPHILSFKKVDSPKNAEIIFDSSQRAPIGQSGNTNSKYNHIAGELRITNSIIIFNFPTQPHKEAQQSMVRVASHELGHALGLRDIYDRNFEFTSVMFAYNYINRYQNANISTIDVDNLMNLYFPK
jgi:predicted Zn-dependent protease